MSMPRTGLLTTKTSQSAYAFTYIEHDIIMLGRESAGVPEAVAKGSDALIRIPMRHGLRSINVAVAAAMILGEALRQTNGFNALA